MNKIAEIILDIAVCGWIVFVIIAIIMTLSSCTFNESAKAMPPVHTLYDGLSAEEKEIYNSFNAEERANVNKNTEMHQLRQALDTIVYVW
tara:strand:- start:121 stop:390 length:270 start_codon:yes stop_codon:yes gene_type:complete